MNPKVSVIISTYNRSARLKRAIDSVLAQTFKDFELIIVDDCSTDDTEEVVKSYDYTDEKIRYCKLDHNTGSDTHPKNVGLAASKGDFIAYLDDDNEFLPYHLDMLYKAFERNPKLDMVYGDMVIYDDANPEAAPAQAITYDFDAQFLMKRNYIDTSEVMHRRDLAFAVGGFDETLPKFIDWNMWVRMTKWGANIQRVPGIVTNYHTHKQTKSAKVETKSWWDPELQMTMFEPTFNPTGCYIYLPYLGNDREEEKHPRVAVFTITYDRLDYTKRMYASMKASTKIGFDWCVFDNGSKDGTLDWLQELMKEKLVLCSGSSENKGITYASNYLLDKIKEREEAIGKRYQIIIKIDNDCEFLTYGWLETLVDLWQRNHMVYMSPYPEGLIDNPGGGPRVGYAYIGPYFVEVATHVGGLCAAIDRRAYDNFRWTDKFLHGNQDAEASMNFRKQRYMPLYLPIHRILHMDTKIGQMEKYPEYFERRKSEKTTQA